MIFSCIYWTCAAVHNSVFLLSWQGLSFLDLRYHLLLFYLQDLTHLISIKTEGGQIKESEALNRVVTIRTVSRHTEPSVLFSCPAETGYHSIFLSCLKILEKMRPLDHKLKYQIDKLVRTAVTGSLGKRFIYSNFCKLWWKKVIDLQIKEQAYGEWEISHRPCFTGLSKQLCHVLLFVPAENDPLQLRPNPENLISKVRPGYHHFVSYFTFYVMKL